MGKSGKIIPAALALAAALSLTGADLVTLDGRIYRDFQVRKIGAGGLTVTFLNDRSEPDLAEIPFDDLPESVRRLYPAAASSAVAKDVSAASGADAGLRKELDDLFRAFVSGRAGLEANDRTGRTLLASQVRQRLERLLARYGQEADCDFVAASPAGMVVRVIGTPAGSPLRSGMYLNIAGGKPPVFRSFRGVFYPTDRCEPCAGYGNLPLYGADLRKAAAVILEHWAGTAGDPLFFASVQEAGHEASGASGTPALQINQQIYVENRRPAWWYSNVWPRGIVIRTDRSCGRDKDRHDKTGSSGKGDRSGKSDKGGQRSDASGAAKSAPNAGSAAPKSSSPSPARNYGLLPEWAIPGR